MVGRINNLSLQVHRYLWLEEFSFMILYGWNDIAHMILHSLVDNSHVILHFWVHNAHMIIYGWKQSF